MEAAVAKAWSHVRANLRRSAGQRLFDQWLKPVVLIEGSNAEVVRLGLPSAFMTQWVKNHYAERLLLEFRGQIPAVRNVSIETLAEEPKRVLSTASAPVAADSAPVAAATASPAERPQFDVRFTFDRFVIDATNRVACNAAKAMAEPGAPRFSPLYLHAGTGQGKTHLMHAIGHAFLEANPEATAIYVTAERFMFEFVQALRNKDTHAFKARLRSVDLLMIDDLQFIGGKDATQQEFFHTVNEFMSSGKRLVIAADRAPQALEGFEPRLAGRLASGLVADIKPAELELRRAIVGRKLQDMPAVTMPHEVMDLLAARITTNVRELEGALNRLVAYAQLNGEVITIDFATNVLGEVLRSAQRRITIDEIQRAVSAHFEVKQIDLISERRAVAIARPRQIAMYLAKRLTTRSLPEIGRKFGNRDHSTVIHAVKRIEELRGKDVEIDTAVRTLMRTLEG
ncbi:MULTISPECIES: chromosomal replication initiator protein DnaA [Sphingomonas]|uniref:Chromosomal replication initiator protein DnaA n=2 Tax=Pseudomonadota TaxID=1224 RepID=A0A7X5UWX4_9SPHN|nr:MULTISPECIES: chromosomal replication initiator protein DnaA [Sphingomonas]NIJ63668.1 chromosomal replication initiator protein [Sphingomonas leidyi]OJY52760.1 MAG: chromosomal replication initiation protein DnaA [Sphingomonas sp. 67-41]